MDKKLNVIWMFGSEVCFVAVKLSSNHHSEWYSAFFNVSAFVAAEQGMTSLLHTSEFILT